jgi:hypothetical protein
METFLTAGVGDLRTLCPHDCQLLFWLCNTREGNVRDPQALIRTSELEVILADPLRRVFDCTTTTVPPPLGSDVPYIVVPSRQAFEEVHIPGADFLDIQGEFSDQTTIYGS